MPRIVFAIVLSMSIFTLLESATLPVPLDIMKLNPSADGKAACRILDKILEHGEEWTNPEECINFFCYDGKILDIDFCDELKTTGPNCVIIPIRPNLDYPYCCPKVAC